MGWLLMVGGMFGWRGMDLRILRWLNVDSTNLIEAFDLRRVWFDMRGAWADLNIYFLSPTFETNQVKRRDEVGGVSLEKVVFPMEKSTESALGAAE